MANFYRRKDGQMPYDPTSQMPFRLSRSKLDLFVDCPRCFYFDRRLGIARPDYPPFTLNNAVDELFKKEFDIHRARGSQHPLMAHYHIDAVPFQHPDIDKWRNALSAGVSYFHEPTRFRVTGGIDDVWVNPAGELIVVDYKATAKKSEIRLYDDYKRQAEIYQWLFLKNGFRVHPTAYFVYANGDTDKKAFDGKLEFNVTIVPHEGDTSWVEPKLFDAKRCLDRDTLPPLNPNCKYCMYARDVAERSAAFDVSDLAASLDAPAVD